MVLSLKTTFKQNYYWMMVTTAITLNSRYWGVPENHIVPVFIWMSWDTNGKGFVKYDGIEFSLPLAVTDNHNPTFNIS
jgi:hypothetical protein